MTMASSPITNLLPVDGVPPRTQSPRGAYMRFLALAAALGWVAAMFAGSAQAGNAYLVNMYIGTAKIPGDRGTEYGGTMPVVQPPFAMTSWTPQTRQNKISATSYAYGDAAISGFIGTHQPAIWMGDYGYVTLMPEVDRVKTTPESRQLPYSHKEEVTTPYYYSVAMDAGAARRIRTEIAATEHCSILRFTFPQNTNATILVEATRPGIIGGVMIDSTVREITGFNPDRMDAHLTSLRLSNFKGYFVVQLSKPFARQNVYTAGYRTDGGTNGSGPNAGATVSFSTAANEQIQVKVGTSFISVEQARANLQAEIPDWNFDTVKASLMNLWDEQLGRVSVHGGTHDQQVQFYTALYHCLLYPRVFSEHGRYYSAFDDQVHAGVAYTAFSGWDIFRSEFSCLTVFCPERINDMIQALLNDYREGGWMPKWPNPTYTDIMLSTPADSLVAEAINKGFHGFDRELAYQAVYKDAMTPPNEDTNQTWPDRSQGKPYSAREGLTYYLKYGYVPDNWTARAASATLEHAYYDWCTAQVAKAVGKTNEYNYFLQRSLNYKHVYHPTTGLMNSRHADGTWAPADHGWTEGGQDLYTFAVMHDVPGLMDLMGGPESFNRTLSSRAVDLNALVNNEPGNHYLYLYDFSGQPSLCQAGLRAALTNFSNTPGGLPGNDDCGQTSSWLRWANLGFYPVNPASGIYMIGSPLFPKVTLHVPHGRSFSIVTTENSGANQYLQSATLNGAALNAPFVTYAQIETGGKMTFRMGPTPSTWAAGWRGKPIQEDGDHGN